MQDPSATTVTIDVTADVCPMTFVRTRLALDRLAPGAELAVRLIGEEPRVSVASSSRALGHRIVSETRQADGTVILVIRKAEAPPVTAP